MGVKDVSPNCLRGTGVRAGQGAATLISIQDGVVMSRGVLNFTLKSDFADPKLQGPECCMAEVTQIS